MYDDILDRLPYKSSFRFVDEILFLDGNNVKANFTLRKDAFFYADHFPGFPVTPGAILTEIMAQAGLVVLGIYLTKASESKGNLPAATENLFPLLVSTDVSFHKMVLPGEQLTILSKKKYFRFNKLKCYVEMFDLENVLVAKGTFAGMIRKLSKGQAI